jgi:hypothetical protein
LALQIDAPPQLCSRCRELGRVCPSCLQRRRQAWSLINERGESLEAAASDMNLAPCRVRELVEEEGRRRDLERFRCDSIPVQLTRAVIAETLARDPDLTIGRIASWLEMAQSDFERAYLGKSKDGTAKRRVNVSNASRLMIALGRAPNELPGC